VRGGLLLALALAPALAAALEPRFDHRDQAGLSLETLLAHDTVAINGQPTRSFWRPALRLAYDWDPFGDGNELFLGLQPALTSWSDPGRRKIRVAIDARYRAYFGLDEWKTFFEVGLWAPLSSRAAVGPLATLGVAYDLSRAGGLYADVGFATGLGAARIATFTASAGGQVRF
jgi:hypothetical protein